MQGSDGPELNLPASAFCQPPVMAHVLLIVLSGSCKGGVVDMMSCHSQALMPSRLCRIQQGVPLRFVCCFLVWQELLTC
jgi:hypothetical protein